MEFRVLGTVEAVDGSKPVDVGHARQRLVLAVLLVEANRRVSADQLLDRVWGDDLPQRGRAALYSYVSRLRTVLARTQGVSLQRRSGGYLLALDEATVDLHRFRRLLTEARASDDAERALSLFDRALALWQGIPFADLDTAWVTSLRSAVEAEHEAAERDRTDVALRCGHHSDLLPNLATRRGDHPLDERLAGQVMLAFYRCGRQADALAEYQRIREALATDQGTDPSPPLQRLYHQILTAAPELAAPAPSSRPVTAPVPRQLPPSVAWFTGRDKELATLMALPGSVTTAPIVAIDGLGGVGKTALAVHFAHQAAGQYPHGQLYLNLHGFDPRLPALSSADALTKLLRGLGVDSTVVPEDIDERIGLYRSILADRRVVIVLDNVASAEQVRALIPGTKSSLVLVTSRNRLGGLIARDGARPISLQPLPPADGRALLAGIVGHDRVGSERQAVDDLVAACGGLPLALRITAERSASRPRHALADIAGELAAEHRRLDLLAAEDDHDTAVRAVLSWSYHALPEPVARAFRLLSLHPGTGFGTPAATALLGLPRAETEQLLRTLVSNNLLEEISCDRHRFHDLIRLYAGEQVATGETERDKARAITGVLDWYTHTAANASDVMSPRILRAPLPPPPEGCRPLWFAGHHDAVDWCATEESGIGAFVHCAAEAGQHTAAWHLSTAMSRFCFLKKAWTFWLPVHRVGLDSARLTGEPTGQIWSLITLSVGYRDLGLPEKTVELDEQALALARDHGDSMGEAWACNLLGLACRDLDRRSEATEYCRHALDIFFAADEGHGQAWAHTILGLIDHDLDRLDTALDHYEQALPLFEESEDPSGMAWVLNFLGRICRTLRRLDDGADYCERALAATYEAGDLRGAVWILNTLSGIHAQRHRSDDAAGCSREALDICRATGDRFGEATVLDYLATTQHHDGHTTAACKNWYQAVEILEQLGSTRRADDVRAHLAHSRIAASSAR